MNFFFGFKNKKFKCEIQIPIFRNKIFKVSNICLYKCYPKNNKWIIKEVINKKINDFFYLLKDEEISNDEIYFLAKKKDLEIFDVNKLKKFNNYTDTSPAYRANFKIYIENGGFSSYQSEYPYSMVVKNGNILSSVNSIANLKANKNYILIRNIFEKPIQEKFKAYLVDINNKIIKHEYILKSNFSNIIEINKKFIKPEIFLVTKKFLGIPIYISTKNKFISCEHTHPLHEYILSDNKFLKVKELKAEINEIIN
jgi:hypothetical protein